MTDSKVFGNDAELFVQTYLTSQGFTILQTNYRQRFGEIDIIACKQNLYIFVEVKARASGLLLHEAISKSKQDKIRRTATYYIQEKKSTDKDCRFDVALLSYQDKKWHLTYIPGAFY